MELARRCEDCRRIVRGTAGDACPYCGGAQLVQVNMAAPLPSLRHPLVLMAVLTFCIGLTLVRVVLIAINARMISSPAYSDLLWNLQLTAGISAVIYLILRRSEGDFRALFLVCLGLFVTTEASSALAREYGLLPLSRLGLLFNMTLLIFSSLSLTAAVADGPRGDRYQDCLVAANMGFLLLSALRMFMNIRNRDFDDRSNSLGTLVLTGIILCVGALLVRGELRARKAAEKVNAPPLLPIEKTESALPVDELKVKS